MQYSESSIFPTSGIELCWNNSVPMPIRDFLVEGLRVLGNPLTVTLASLKRILTTEYDEKHTPQTTEGEEGFPISWAEQIKNNYLLERFLTIFADVPAASATVCLSVGARIRRTITRTICVRPFA